MKAPFQAAVAALAGVCLAGTSVRAREPALPPDLGPSVEELLAPLLLPARDQDPTVDAEAWAAFLPDPETDSWAAQLAASQRASFQTAADRSRPFPLPPATRLLPGRAAIVPVYHFAHFHLTGNTVFSSNTLEALIEPFRNRPLQHEDLDQLRTVITRHYITHEYFNSGAVIPDQELKGDTLHLEIIEGRLTESVITTKQRLRDSYLRARLLGDTDRPLHFPDLQRRLQVLQTNPNITRINAELKPGPMLGESWLEVEIEEPESFWSYGLEFNNQRSASIGAEQIEAWARTTNLTGDADAFDFRYKILTGGVDNPSFSGAANAYLRYSRPILRDDTALELTLENQDYAILEEPFDALNIEGESSRVSLAVSRPVIRSLNDSFILRVGLDHRRSATELLGEPFSLSPAYVNGKLNLTCLRLDADWTRRLPDQVIALRSTVTAGIDGWGSTNPTDGPDASFFSWNVAGQYLRRLSPDGHLLVVRGGFQLASDSLPPPEQITLGGHHTVRGYRENSLVRDMGTFVGVDYRWPLETPDPDSPWTLHLVPFINAGLGWNHDNHDREYLLSAGLGLTAGYDDWLQAELFWGLPLNDISDTGGDLQDLGLHFRVNIARF